MEEVENVLDILSVYESGQKLNMEKSSMSFSLEQDKIDLLQLKLSFKAIEGHDILVFLLMLEVLRRGFFKEG